MATTHSSSATVNDRARVSLELADRKNDEGMGGGFARGAQGLEPTGRGRLPNRDWDVNRNRESGKNGKMEKREKENVAADKQRQDVGNLWVSFSRMAALRIGDLRKRSLFHDLALWQRLLEGEYRTFWQRRIYDAESLELAHRSQMRDTCLGYVRSPQG